MERSRNVMITLGKKDYSIETFLDDNTLNRVIVNIQRSFTENIDPQDQEKSLLLACLDLSYRLDSVSRQSQDERETDLSESESLQ